MESIFVLRSECDGHRGALAKSGERRAFPAIATFIINLLEETGCVVGSVECYAPDYDLVTCQHRSDAERRCADAGCRVEFKVGGQRFDEGGPFERGVTLMGAPIGSAAAARRAASESLVVRWAVGRPVSR